MTISYVVITPHDPIIARDARPFGAGIRMKSLDWPYPSVIAGSLRTALGKKKESFDPVTVEELKQVSIHGPLPSLGGHLYFPSPRDILVNKISETTSESYAIRPINLLGGEDCDLPLKGLSPAMVPERVKEEFKPFPTASFWSEEAMISWLLNTGNEQFDAPLTNNLPETNPAGLGFPPKESRFHVKIDSVHGSYEEGMFFESIGLDLTRKNQENEGLHLSARIEADNGFSYDITSLNKLATCGGERRLSYVKSEIEPKVWTCPASVKTALKETEKIRMILATPAIFSKGWLPGWINETTLTGCPPGVAGLNLKLVSASVERWKPLSGFSLEKGKTGPKTLRRLVPAGSVYFFEITQGNGEALANIWLRPVSDTFDDGQERRDGFGLALWGVWDFDNKGIMNTKQKEG